MSAAPRIALAAALAVLAGCGGTATKVGPSSAERTREEPIVYERSGSQHQPDAPTQLFERRPDGTTRLLVRVPGGARQPAWSPDRRRIAFVRGLPNAAYEIYEVLAERRVPAGRPEIATTKADGTGVRPLATGCAAAPGCLADTLPAYAPDGRLSFLRVYGPAKGLKLQHMTAFEYAGRTDLMVVPAGGGAPRALVHWDRRLEPWDGAPSWSPDGRRLVVALGSLAHGDKHTIVGTALFVLDAGSGRARRITPWNLGAGYPDWSPDGSQIVFASEGGHSPSLYVVRPDGTGLRQVLQGDVRSTVGFLAQPVWSPDGRRIAFAAQPRVSSSYRISQVDLFTVNPDGSRVRRLTATPAYESAPAWSAP